MRKKDPEEIRKEATTSAVITNTFSVTVNNTETGWLRVRTEPTLNASEAAKITPGRTFEVKEEKEGWYRIEYEKGKLGWVSSNYVTKVTATTPSITPDPEGEDET
ncbi:MAG: Bacterial SH3 domain protein [Microgenomates bacterium OLB23]|nr:MAG: Bacterial SH3 domain protein [Microgenomates bacterium OLB23]